jgi:hypothetical protein
MLKIGEDRWGWIGSILPLLFVVGATLRLYWNIAKGTDLPLVGDEAMYLTLGSHLLHQGILPSFPFSPLYACWYALHFRLFGDPIATYYAQIQVVAVLTAIFIYVYLRMIEVPRFLCVLGALLWIAQPAYLTLDFGLGHPRPYHFAFLIFLVGATVLRRLNFESRVPFALAGTAFMLFVMAVREEYVISLVFLVFIIAFWQRKPSLSPGPHRRREYLLSLALWAAAATLTLWMLLKGKAQYPVMALGHSWCAFAQHFSVYRVGASPGSALDPWADWEFIAGQVFPGAHSIGGALLANPKAFLIFELHNILTAPRILFAYLAVPPYALLKGMALGMTLGWIGFFSSTTSSLRRQALATSASALGPFVLSGAATALPVALITPKINYFLPLLFVLLAGLLKWLSLILKSEPDGLRLFVPLSAAALSLILVVIRSPFEINPNSPRPQYREVTEIRSILEAQKNRPIRVLQYDVPYRYGAFLPYGLAEMVDPFSRQAPEGFRDFMARQHVEAVILDAALRSCRPFRDDPEFALFQRSPGEWGWKATPVGMPGDFLCLRERGQ